MKNTELRIGNLVFDAFGNAVKCDLVMIFNIELMRLKPIPLTEDRLLEFGFKKSEDDWYDLGSIGVNFELKRMVYITHDTEGNEVYNDIPFKEFVHDFQNLVFALTNDELKTV